MLDEFLIALVLITWKGGWKPVARVVPPAALLRCWKSPP